MPDKEVNTIKDLIHFQYAKIIAKSTLDWDGDGKELSVLDLDLKK